MKGKEWMVWLFVRVTIVFTSAGLKAWRIVNVWVPRTCFQSWWSIKQNELEVKEKELREKMGIRCQVRHSKCSERSLVISFFQRSIKEVTFCNVLFAERN